MLQQMTVNPRPAARDQRSEGYRRAHSVNSFFMLHALAALKLPQRDYDSQFIQRDQNARLHRQYKTGWNQ